MSGASQFVFLVRKVKCLSIKFKSSSACIIFFVKQKTAYDMRISDWSSDVCSSDLAGDGDGRVDHARRRHADGAAGAVEQSHAPGQHPRSEERRVGKEGVSPGRSRWSAYH